MLLVSFYYFVSFKQIKMALTLVSCLFQQFDEKLLNPTSSKAMPEKRKKDMFKKLIQDVIGVSLCKGVLCFLMTPGFNKDIRCHV